MKINHLSLSWSISRGRDTYGYNICRLDSRDTGKRYKCSGGGYDMVGTVFGRWLREEHQDKLQKLTGWNADNCGCTDWKAHPEHYGAFLLPDGTIRLDGACGIESMLRIAEAIDLDVQREYIRKGKRRGETIGWFVSVKGE